MPQITKSIQPEVSEAQVKKQFGVTFVDNFTSFCSEKNILSKKAALNLLDKVASLNQLYYSKSISIELYNKSFSDLIEMSVPKDRDVPVLVNIPGLPTAIVPKDILWNALFWVSPLLSAAEMLPDKIAGYPKDLAESAIKIRLDAIKPKKQK